MEITQRKSVRSLGSAVLFLAAAALGGCQNTPDVTVTGSPEMDSKIAKPAGAAASSSPSQTAASATPAFENGHRPKKTSH